MSGDLDLTAAVEAAAVSLYAAVIEHSTWDEADDEEHDTVRDIARAATTAAAPLIEAAVREQVAREIEALTPGAESVDDHVTLRAAARIARGQS